MRPQNLATLAAAIALVLTAAVVPSVQSAADTATGCPSVTLSRTEAQSSGIQADNTEGTWDLTGASWSNHVGGDYPVRSEAWVRGCLVGGSVVGPIPRTATRDQWYDAGQAGSGDVYRISLTSTAGNYLRQVGSYAS